MSAKDIILRPIEAPEANAFVREHHYSGKVAPNSQIHAGVFWRGALEGVLSFGPSLDRRKMLGLVEGTEWNQLLELNRMVFTDRLPRNSESRAIAVMMRLLRRHAPHLKWVVSYADATMCGDGTIYRASGFVLTAIKKNTEILRLEDGTITHSVAQKTGKAAAKLYAETKGASRAKGTPLEGFQLRYIYFLDPTWRSRLTVPEVPFSAIEETGATMYRGERTRAK